MASWRLGSRQFEGPPLDCSKQLSVSRRYPQHRRDGAQVSSALPNRQRGRPSPPSEALAQMPDQTEPLQCNVLQSSKVRVSLSHGPVRQGIGQLQRAVCPVYVPGDGGYAVASKIDCEGDTPGSYVVPESAASSGRLIDGISTSGLKGQVTQKVASHSACIPAHPCTSLHIPAQGLRRHWRAATTSLAGCVHDGCHCRRALTWR